MTRFYHAGMKKSVLIVSVFLLSLFLLACEKKSMDHMQYIGKDKLQAFSQLDVTTETVIPIWEYSTFGCYQLPDSFSYLGMDFLVFLMIDPPTDKVYGYFYGKEALTEANFSEIKSIYEQLVKKYGEPFNKAYMDESLAMIETIHSLEEFEPDYLSDSAPSSIWYTPDEQHQIRMELWLHEFSETGQVTLKIETRTKQQLP